MLLNTYSKLLILILALGLTNCVRNDERKTHETSKQKSDIKTDTQISKLQQNSSIEIMKKAEVPVLCYHRITEGRSDAYTVSPSTFISHMKELADSGYHSITPDQLYNYLVYNKSLPEKPVMITFDDSRIEHYTIAAAEMEKQGFRGTFFIMTITRNKANYLTDSLIKKLSDKGHCIGLHSWDHTMVTKYVEADWQKQVVDQKEKLQKLTSKPIEYWAYPNGVFNHSAASNLNKHFKLSFILSTKRDSLLPLQCVRRIIVPDWNTKTFIRSIRTSFR